MLFNSLSFLLFFPICILIFFLCPKVGRKYWLLAASLYFYMCWNVTYGLLLLGTILITYLAGLLLDKVRDRRGSSAAILAVSLTLNFSILFVFKYFDFFLSTMNKVLSKMGAGASFSLLELILPVGISFYIFQAVGYVIDVYRGKSPEKHPVRYALFVSFFPQLVAGPIERSGNLLAQIQALDTRKAFEEENVVKGATTMLYGYFMKMMIADRASILVNTVFDKDAFMTYGGFEVLLAAVLFSVQIYCDFAGYTYIAIGAARVMGFRLCDNFHAPYLATGIKEFWSRWHISLTTWFKDYLYFPLGGSKKGTLRKYLNIFFVFLVSGLWHGASWHFVVWGALHGVLRILDEVTQKGREKLASLLHYDRTTQAHKLLMIVVNFLIVTVAWVFFRAESTAQAVALLKNMVVGLRPWQLTDDSLLALGLDGKEMNVLIFSILIMVFVDFCKQRKMDLTELFYRQNVWFQFLLFFVGIITIVIFGIYGKEYNASQFIYFQF